MKRPCYYLKAWYFEEDEEHENHEFSAYVGKDGEGNVFYTDEFEDALMFGRLEEAEQFKKEAEKNLLDVSVVSIYAETLPLSVLITGGNENERA